MKFSKLFAGCLGLGLAIALGTPTLAQMTPTSPRNTTPGNTTSPGGLNQTPYNRQQPYNQSPLPSSRTQVMVPPTAESMSIETIVSESPSFELFNALLRVAAIEGGDLITQLGSDNDYVVYAPTDEALAALPEGTIKRLVQPENRELLVQILSYHIVPASESDTALFDEDESVQGSTTGEATQTLEENAPPVNEVDSPSPLSDATSSLTPGVDLEESPRFRSDRATGTMMVNDARVIGTAIQAENGAIYPVDRIILPPSAQAQLSELGLVPATGTPIN